MTNADKFKSIFGLYATELWAKPEKDFLEWLNADVELFGISEQLESDHVADPGKMVGDLISKQAALEAMDTWDKFGCDPDGKLVRYDDDSHYVPYVHYDDMVHAIKHLPSAQPEPLTDKEQRIFLAAMSREEKVCKKVDEEWVSGDEEREISLVHICHEIIRKVKGALWTA